ncbi:hypothetical protein [Paenibacillus sp. TH7-28]
MNGDRSHVFPGLTAAIGQMAGLCEGAEAKWLLGGSCGLWLQGVRLDTQPRDIDVYADEADARLVHERLREFATDVPRQDRTGSYASLLSHYRLDGVTVELVGGFEVKTASAFYRTEIAGILEENAPLVRLDGAELRLMPLAHEFVFNVLRERPDRYLAIAEVIRGEADRHLPLLSELLGRNQWTAGIVGKMAEVLDRPLLSGPWGEYGGGQA